ncbi:thiamine phosphate synthase [Burkholderiales bacterium]|nr:thiamine phosphate synthase [Burkholderiales bacterium]
MKAKLAKVFESGIYAITPDTDNLSSLISHVERALRGGIRLFQFRNKVSSPDQKIIAAKLIKDLVHSSDGLLIINDDPYLAKMVDACGVHIGKHDQKLDHVRAILGPEKIIGVSCYDDIPLALRMQDQGADYIAFGAFFPSSSKSSATPAPLNVLRQASASGITIPVVAIGGITLNNAEDLLNCGPCVLAVINSLFGLDDVESRAREWVNFYGQFKSRLS